MEFALKYEMLALLRHEKFSETHVLVTLLIRNALLFDGKKISCISGINKSFQNFWDFWRSAPLMWFEFEILPNFPLGFPKTDFKNIYMYIKHMVF